MGSIVLYSFIHSFTHSHIQSQTQAFLLQSFYNKNCIGWDQLIKNNGLHLLLIVMNICLLKLSSNYTSFRKEKGSSQLHTAIWRSCVINLSHQRMIKENRRNLLLYGDRKGDASFKLDGWICSMMFSFLSYTLTICFKFQKEKNNFVIAHLKM